MEIKGIRQLGYRNMPQLQFRYVERVHEVIAFHDEPNVTVERQVENFVDDQVIPSTECLILAAERESPKELMACCFDQIGLFGTDGVARRDWFVFDAAETRPICG
jgi:hypothetical protein